jgi:hypothetical protein
MTRHAVCCLHRLLPPLFAAAALAACAAGAVGPANVGGSYDPRMLNYVAAKGALHTRVLGNPFEAPQERLDAAVTGAMAGAHFGPPIRFSAKPDPGNPSPYHVVVMFNPGRGVTARKACADPQQPTAGPSGGTLRVLMAFCSADADETSVSARLARAGGPDDPAFRALIRQMTGRLLPARNPDPIGADDFDI